MTSRPQGEGDVKDFVMTVLNYTVCKGLLPS